MAFVKPICLFLLINCLLYCNPLGIPIQHEKFPVMLRHVGKILSECTWQEMHDAGVVRHSKSNWNWPIEFLSNVSAVNLKDSETAEEFEALTYQNTPRRHQKLHTFIILTYSSSNFERLVNKLRKTVLWNPVAQYFILDDQKESTSCQNALTFLNISWTEDLLHSTYFCEHPNDSLTMYTYNPYTRKAPEPWQEVNAFQYTFKNHVWSLFKQKLIPGRTTCRDFNFDKTISMNGHPLNALAVHNEDTLVVSKNGTGLERVGGPEPAIIKTALAKLNPKLNLSVVLYSKNTSLYMYDIAVDNGAYDIMLNNRYMYNKFNSAMTYPHEYSGISIMTQYPEYEKEYVRILTYMNPKVIGAVFLVFASTSLVLCICTGKGLIHSFVEAYRLLLGTSTVRSPRRNPLRIYLTTVTLLFMLTNAVFQSSLSTLLTTPIRKPYVETVDDLRKNPDFILYVSGRHKRIIVDEWMEPQIRIGTRNQCTKHVKENRRVGCASDQKTLISKAEKESLHVSRTRLVTLFQTYVVRQNWPLRERLSAILGTLAQAGIIGHLRDNPLNHILEKWRVRERDRMSKGEFHVITLSKLVFAFYILVLGFGLATIVFFLELYVAKG